MGGRGLGELFDILKRAAQLAEREPTDERDLLNSLGETYQGLFLADFAHYDVAEVRAHAPELVHVIFSLYLDLRACIPAWQRQGLMTRSVQAVLRDVFRAARYARDLIGEIGLGHPRLAKGETVHAAFAGPEAYLEINRNLGLDRIELRPGDVVLQRGMVHNSAAIARIGDVDSQFSHIAIVARDPAGELAMVEALIEEGAVITPLETALRHGLGRAILLRHRDAGLAGRAAEMIRAAIARADGKAGPRILYDFSMELAGYHDLYCAKLVRLAYSMASTGGYRLPTYATRLDMLNRDFIRRIGVTATETFAPGDLELEPDFDIVAEWRDFRVTSELRLKDMIMVKLFEWMELRSYRFHPSLLVELIGLFGTLSARMPPGVQKLTSRLAGKVPPNMSGSAVGAVAMLHWTAEELYRELRREEDESIRASGRQLHPRLVLSRLEQMREKRGRHIGYLISEHWDR
jgi:hypothetical protein